MKKNHFPAGASLCLRTMPYAIAFIAMIAARENFTEGSGPVSRQLGMFFNETLKAGSKLGLGFALMTRDEYNDDTLAGRASLAIGKASHKAFVSASKVDIYQR